MNNLKLKKRILEISKKLGLSHIGSCLSVLPILEEIYAKKKRKDIVLMDNGHASLAHYVVLESLGGKNAEEMFHKHGVHANRDVENGLYASNGSLGHNGGISIGLSLANRNRICYTIFSDGSIQEGTFYEVCRIRNELKLFNMKCYFNINGFTAVSKIDKDELVKKIKFLCPDANIRLTFNGEGFDGVQGHYKKL